MTPEKLLGRATRQPNGCLRWTGAVKPNGYGIAAHEGKVRSVHRLIYTFLVGPIPDAYELDHTCHTNDVVCPGDGNCLHRRCVNPAHLEPVTHRENTRRGRGFAGINARRTHCPSGHPYDEANTLVSRTGGRSCRPCHAEGERARRLAVVA